MPVPLTVAGVQQHELDATQFCFSSPNVFFLSTNIHRFDQFRNQYARTSTNLYKYHSYPPQPPSTTVTTVDAFEFWHQHLRQVHVSERRDALHHTDKGLPSAERHVSLQEWSEQHQDRRTVGGGLQAQGSCQSDPTPQTVPTNGKLSSLHISQDLRWAQVVGLGGCLLGGVNQLNQLHKIVHQMGVLVDHTALSTRVTMPLLGHRQTRSSLIRQHKSEDSLLFWKDSSGR